MKRITGTLLLAAVFLLSGFGTADAALRGNPGSKTYHAETCKYAKAQGATAVFATSAEAIGKGFAPCTVCLPAEAKSMAAAVTTPYVGNAKSKVFHKAGCKVAPKKKFVPLNNLLEAHKQGFKPCKTCNPASKAASMMQK